MPSIRPKLSLEIRTGHHDRTNAFLTALVFLLGGFVLLGTLIWLLTVFAVHPYVEARVIDSFDVHDNDQLTRGVSNSLDEPGAEEFPEMEVPQLQTTLELAQELPSHLHASLEQYESNHLATSRGNGPGTKGGPPRRQPPIFKDDDYKRWQIEYQVDDLDAYIQRLDYFDIELGLVSLKTPRIDMIVNLGDKPATKISKRSAQKRLYFLHHDETFKKFDRSIAKKLGFKDFDQKMVVQFYPDKLAAKLKKLEKDHASKKGLKLESVESTTFSIRSTEDGFEFYVDKMK